jgi:hypothetical protein
MAHVVAHAIGAPAQRQLAEIACADDEALVLPGKAEQVIGAKPSLHVFERHVMHRLSGSKRVADIFKHGRRSGANVDLTRGDFHRPHEPVGVRFGAFGRAETGHGIPTDRCARQA